MPRVPPRERIAAIAGAATRVFGRQGYRGTRTAEVAAVAGLSSGALFTYVESKEALFHLVFAFGFGLYDDALPSLPIPTPGPGETVSLIVDALRKVPAPALRAALAEDDPPDAAAELRGIVEERYATLEALWPVLAVIERCAVEVPELEDAYFDRVRRSYFAALTRYLEARAVGGHLRATPDAAVAARVVSESITWFAWHRHEGRDAVTYDDDVTRRTVVDLVCAALLPKEHP
jgi:AcrR family transcriptional regulator